jgi:hypothetical protein
MITIFILMTFFIFVTLKASSGKTKLEYPVTVDCSEIEKQFLDASTNGKINMDTYFKFAKKDSDYTETYLSSGMYQCYCRNEDRDKDSDLCDLYSNDMIKSTGLSTAVSFLITVINVVIRTINMRLIDYVG